MSTATLVTGKLPGLNSGAGQSNRLAPPRASGAVREQQQRNVAVITQHCVAHPIDPDEQHRGRIYPKWKAVLRKQRGSQGR